VLGLLSPGDYRHNLIAQALNEYFLDRHEVHPGRYRDLPTGGGGARPAGIAGRSYWPGSGEPMSSPVSTRQAATSVSLRFLC
jgi:hypothetical protein